jgi:hypothetical protein
MFKRWLTAAVVTGAAIGIMAAIKLITEDEEEEDYEEKDENEVRFIELNDGEEISEASAEQPAEAAEEYSPEIKEIAELYPYLDLKFVAEQFGRNDAFNEQYPEDSLVSITHKAKFDDQETRDSFVKIGEDNGYAAEVLNDAEVTITRKMFTEDGAILSDIYNVANQVACLKGIYEGYFIEV